MQPVCHCPSAVTSNGWRNYRTEPNDNRDSNPGIGHPGRRALLLLLFLSTINHPLSTSAQAQYALPWFKIAGSGATAPSTGGVYALSGTIGQVDTGRVASTNACRIEAGFWAIAIQQLGYPSLNIAKAGGTNCFISWLTAEPGMILQQATTLGTPTAWSDVPDLVSTNGLTNLVQQAIATGVSNRYYRLRRPLAGGSRGNEAQTSSRTHNLA